MLQKERSLFCAQAVQAVIRSLLHVTLTEYFPKIGIIIILHHFITSFRIASHHTSYCINDTRMEYRADFRKILSKLHEVSFELQLRRPAHKRDLSFQSMDIFICTNYGSSFFSCFVKKETPSIVSLIKLYFSKLTSCLSTFSF